MAGRMNRNRRGLKKRRGMSRLFSFEPRKREGAKGRKKNISFRQEHFVPFESTPFGPSAPSFRLFAPSLFRDANGTKPIFRRIANPQETTQALEKQGLVLLGAPRSPYRAQIYSTPRGVELGAGLSGKTTFPSQHDAESDAFSGDSTSGHPGLQEIIQAWPALPEAVRQQLVKLVSTANSMAPSDGQNTEKK
jgi:hypothetical protein